MSDGHLPRLVNWGAKCDTGYCAVCEHYLRRCHIRGGRHGLWRAVWSRSAVCTGPPLRIGKPS